MSDNDDKSSEKDTKHRVVNLRAVMRGNASLSVTGSVSTSFALLHLQSAMLFSQRCSDVESLATIHNAPEIENARAEHRAYVTGAIFSSVAFLEATINEFFAGSMYASDQINARFSAQVIELIRNVWKHFLSEKSKYTMLEKYQLALTLINAAPFPEKGDRTPPQVGSFQDIGNLVTLRNALMHYKPLWESNQNSEDKDVRNLKSMLKSRFSASQNPLYDPRSHFLHVYLGCACAKWTVKASVTFANDFFNRIGLPTPYEHLRGKWSL